MLLILAAGAAISAGKLVDKSSMYKINHDTKVELINEENYNQDQTALTAQKCKLIKEKMEKVFTDLKLENLQGKSDQEQKDAALQVLKYLIYNTTPTYPLFNFNKTDQKQDTTNLNQFDNEINLIYNSLCDGKNIDPKAQCITLSFLYQMLGLDSKHATIQKDDYKYVHEIVVVNFADGEQICDPTRAELSPKDLCKNRSEYIFCDPKAYFEVIYKDYQFANEQNTTALTTDLIDTITNDNDTTLER